MQTTAEFAAAGHEVVVLRYRGWRGVRVQRATWEGIDVRAVPLVLLLPVALGLAVVRRPDVVHAHGLLGGKVGALVATLSRCRMVLEFHAVGPDLRQADSLTGPRGVGHRAAAHLLRSRLATVVCYSQAQAREVVAAGWATTDRVEVIYPSVDDGFSLAPRPVRPLRRERPVVCYAGNFNPYQGVDLLLEAMRSVWERRPDARLQLWGADPGDAAVLGDLVEDDRVELCGRVELSRMPGVLAAADVLVIPRPDLEMNSTTGRKLGEYLASARPVVATDVADHRALLGDTGVGYVVAPTSDGVAAGVLDALEHPEDAAERAERGLDLAARRFSPAVSRSRRLALLRRAAGHR